MNAIENFPVWFGIPLALLLVLCGCVVLIGSFGLLRLPHFYQRIHAPSILVVFGTACAQAAGIIYFSVSESSLRLHEFLIGCFILASAPVVSMLLLRTAVYRKRRATDDGQQKPEGEEPEP